LNDDILDSIFENAVDGKELI